MKVYIDRFVKNNPELKIEDVVSDIQVGVDKNGIISTYFKTSAKYVYVRANGSVCGPDYKGLTIDITPIVYTEEGDELYETDYDAYYDHLDYYSLNLIVETDNSSYRGFVTAGKYHCFVTHMPFEMIFNYDVLQEPEIIEFVYED